MISNSPNFHLKLNRKVIPAIALCFTFILFTNSCSVKSKGETTQKAVSYDFVPVSNLIKENKIDRALKELEREQKLHPNNADIRIQKALCYEMQGDFDKASQELVPTFEKLGPYNHFLGNVFIIMARKIKLDLKSDQLDDAIKYSDKLMQKANSYLADKELGEEATGNALAAKPYAHMLRGSAYFRQGKYKLALSDFSEVSSSDYLNSQGLYLTAQTYDKMGDKNSAKRVRSEARKQFSELIEEQKKVMKPGAIGPIYYLATPSELETETMIEVSALLGQSEKAKELTKQILESKTPWAQEWKKQQDL